MRFFFLRRLRLFVFFVLLRYVSVLVCLRFPFRVYGIFFRFAGDEGHLQLGKDTPTNGRADPSPVDACPGTVLFEFLGGFPCEIPWVPAGCRGNPFPLHPR